MHGTVVVVVGAMFGAVVGGREVDDVVVGCRVAVVEVVVGVVVEQVPNVVLVVVVVVVLVVVC